MHRGISKKGGNMLKDADNITPAVRNLLNKDTGVVFDCDGVLCVYELGEKRHMACPDEEWEDYVRNEKPYDKAMPVRQIQRFIKDKGVDNVYVCSKASDFEAEQKKNFVMREYGIPEDHICIVTSKPEKIEFMKKLAKEKYNNREDKVALVEDTVSTLDDVYMESDFLTIHVSSFMSY